ncbi:superfamily II DNA or RNA helicase [Brevibacillus aydinogluensis]|jgi:hypothetical protein|uniref:DEAD/DEAH box helicase n=1 Tax=Brevibacillus aydinogluensis TaxID=927786 RepID=UPI002892B2C9|nr:DEAD/DEAH box helicase [Brevibacillus aydinogluensis]MDT3417452.1 superfamily II DNA or RNA helicase [Brevibacillus aydinogluensis]
MSDNKITIRKFKNDLKESNFFDIYKALLLGKLNLVDDKRYLTPTLFKLALLLMNFGDQTIKKLGYRLILRYSNITKDYKPLYDIAIASDYIPISKFIEKFLISDQKDSFNSLILSAYNENYKVNNMYLTRGQKELISFSIKELNDYVIIAPTSYGKSDMMVNLVKQNQGKKICIVVPTKALLSQTKRNLVTRIDLEEAGRIIIHPDMYNGDEKFVAVLTQERLLRLIQKYPDFKLDMVLIDEAHSLLEDTHRAHLLAFVLIILKKRNPSVSNKYFTPFLIDPSNINIPYLKTNLISKRSTEYLKVEKFFYVSKKGNDTKVFLFDQFLNETYLSSTMNKMSDIEFVIQHSGNKNIVYLNKSKDIEDVANLMSKQIDTQLDDDVLELCNNIADYLHKDYNLIKYLKKGVLYHHGTMPDLIRLYVEHIFREKRSIKFIITSSTLLEGVNIPSEKLFILDIKKGNSNLTPAQLRNLVGRVSRFKDVFDEKYGSIELLEPEIYIVDGDYVRNKNIYSFISKSLYEGRDIKDSKDNIMLKTEDEIKKLTTEEKESFIKTIQTLENIEPRTIDTVDVKYVESLIGRSCFLNNIVEFDVIENEQTLQKNLSKVQLNAPISDTDQLIKTIDKVFLTDITFKKKHDALIRLKHEKTQRFYSMMLSWRMKGSSYKKLISNFVGYWNTLSGDDAKIYVGKWGEIKWSPDDLFNLYVDISTKSSEQKINLAILRIKEEQDFIDNHLMKFIEILNDLGMLDKEFYEMIKYGSSNPKMICLLKNGFSIELARFIIEKSPNELVEIDVNNDKVKIDPKLINFMIDSKVNDILVFELKYHVKVQV